MRFRRSSVPPHTPRSERGSTHPFQVTTMVGALFAGLLNLVFRGSETISSVLTTQFDVAWCVMMMVGGGAALIATYGVSDTVTSLLIERAALILVGVGSGTYGVMLFVVNGTAAVAIGPLALTSALGALWRLFDVQRELRQTEENLSRVKENDREEI